MIEKLKELGSDNQKLWMELEDEEKDEFIHEFLNYAQFNLEEIERFVQQEPLDFMGTSAIAHEILSDYSSDYNDFTKREIERIVNAALSKSIKPSKLESLENLYLDNIYESDPSLYDEVILFIIEAIQKADKEKLKLKLIAQLDEFLMTDDNLERWEEKLNATFHSESENVKNALKDIFSSGWSKFNISRLLHKDLIFGFISFIIYAIIFIHSIELYKKTFIGLKEIVILAFAGGVIGLIYNLLKGKKGKNAIKYFAESVLEWGIPVVGITLFLNYYSNIGDEIKKEVKILKKIEYIEETKIAKIFVHHEDYEKMVNVQFPDIESYDESSEIYLLTKEGGLGMDILTDTQAKQ